MDRRKFIRTGSLALAGAVAAPTLASALPGTKVEAATLAVPETGNKGGVAAAMEHFGVTEADLRKTMTAALERGG